MKSSQEEKMHRILAIVSKNRQTFYDYGTEVPQSIFARVITTIIISVICGFVLDGEVGDFLSNVITIQAILIGFSFSVMFFLISNKGIDDDGSGSLERELKRKRLNKLSHEIFDNVAYFNLVAMGCLLMAVLLASPPLNTEAIKCASKLLLFANFDVRDLAHYLARSISIFTRSLFYFFLIESAYTFSRTVGRVNYYFDMKLKFMGGEPNG
jgi:hypothetical protein